MRVGLFLTMTAGGIAATLLAAVPSSAQDRGVEAERERLVAAKLAASQAMARARRLERDATVAGDQADAARAREAAVAARIRAREADIGAAQARVAILRALQRRQAQLLARQQGPVVRLMAALQSLARRPAATAIARPGSITDLVHVRATLATVLPVIRTRTQGVRGELERARRLRGGADLAVASLAAGRRRLAEERAGLVALEQRHRGTARDLSRGAMYEQDRAIAMGEEARDIVDLMDQMDADADLGERLAALPGPPLRPVGTTQASAPGAYRLPARGRVVTGFGEVSDSGVRSRGIAIATTRQAVVAAPAAGRIVYAGPFRRYGAIVVIDHGAGWSTLVTGLGTLGVRAGGVVGSGAAIGRAGGARPRVTIELRRHGRPVDAAALIG